MNPNSVENRLAKAHEACAEAENLALTMKRIMERKHATIFLRQAGNNAEREAKTRTHEDYLSAEDDYLDAANHANLAKAQRNALEVLWETWRTNESTRRAEMRIL